MEEQWQEIVGLTVHLPFVGKDDFASTTWRIYRESFLKALFDIRRPHAFRVRCRQVLLVLENDRLIQYASGRIVYAIFYNAFVVAVQEEKREKARARG